MRHGTAAKAGPRHRESGLIDSETASQLGGRNFVTLPFEPTVSWDVCVVKHKRLHTSSASDAMIKWLLGKRLARRRPPL
jgi:DNA-binding transcriptional LysR family regulator